ncbi:MAG: VTT domain-containing protein, partial [Eubacteriaceae bacterium]
MKKNSGLNYKLIIKKFLPITIFIAAIIAVFIIYGRDMLNIFSKPENIKSYIESKGRWGVLIYIALQILQIVIAVIPGEPIQIAGGYIYGTFKGFLYAEIGIMAGSAIAFFIARKFGITIVK